MSKKENGITSFKGCLLSCLKLEGFTNIDRIGLIAGLWTIIYMLWLVLQNSKGCLNG